VVAELEADRTRERGTWGCIPTKFIAWADELLSIWP